MTIHIDRTGPTVTGPGLGRPPDSGEWFNHPVAFGFTGQDATSGIESCTGGTYSGPDGAGVGVEGSCRDVAGNVTARTFTLNYDATPPPKPEVSVLPGNRRVALTWPSSQYVAEVVRMKAASAQSVVYRGAGGRFVDRRLRNGRRYRYAVTLTDQAGNTASDRVERGADPLASPPPGGRRPPPRSSRARLEARQARAVLQRAADLPRPQGPDPLAGHEPASARRAVELAREQPSARAGALLLVRLARLR